MSFLKPNKPLKCKCFIVHSLYSISSSSQNKRMQYTTESSIDCLQQFIAISTTLKKNLDPCRLKEVKQEVVKETENNQLKQ